MNDIRMTILGQDLSKASNALIIESEEQAWEFLERLTNNDDAIPEDIAFGEWAKFDIYLKGKNYNSSLIIRNAEWNKTQIHAEINIRELRDKIISADLISVRIPDNDNP